MMGSECTGGAGSIVLPDSSVAIMDDLFAPFSEDQFPRQLDHVKLTSLLRANPTTAVPV